MSKRYIQPKSVHQPGAYAHGVLTKAGLLFISGQVAKDIDNASIGAGDIEAQAVQVFENIGEILKEAGGGFADLVRLNIFLTDPRYVETYFDVRSRYLKSAPYPASTGVVVASLGQPEWLLEIDAIAEIG